MSVIDLQERPPKRTKQTTNSPNKSHARHPQKHAHDRDCLSLNTTPPKMLVHDEIAREHLDTRGVDEHAGGYG